MWVKTISKMLQLYIHFEHYLQILVNLEFEWRTVYHVFYETKYREIIF